MLKAGIVLILGVLAADFVGRVQFSFGELKFEIQGGMGSGLPSFFAYSAYGIAVVLVVVGGLIMWFDDRREKRKFLVVVEVRGLHSSPDTPAKDKVMPAFRGLRHSVLVDFRPSQAGELLNPDLMLSKIKGMKLNVESATHGRDMSDVAVAVGGVAAVPGLFLIGMLFEDESKIERYDWNRDLKSWKMIDALDDGNRTHPLEIPPISAADTEVVLAVSASYLVNDTAIAAAFPGLPVARLSAEKVQANSFWAEEVQKAFAIAFRNAMQELLHRHVKRIHLVLAAPASLSLLLGSTYDERLHPELIVYQYENSSVPPYPWGVVLPKHGTPEARIERTAPLAA